MELRNSRGRILFDPFVPLPHAETRTRPEEYDGFTDIFITHGHFDHIASLPQIIGRNPGATVHCTQTPYRTLLKKGIPEKNLALLEYGSETALYGFNISVYHGKHALLPRISMSRLLKAAESPARGNLPLIVRENRQCAENDETVFYRIESEGRTAALMGSLNLRDEVDYPTLADVLVLPYNGWEDNYPPFVAAIERLKPKRVLLDHYDNSFPPVTSPLDISPALGYRDLKVSAMRLGEREEV